MTDGIFIEKIEIAAFGMLKNTVIVPSEGINLFCAPNESGKTTVASFIKFVLYGFSGARTQSIRENGKKLYSPWDGASASGAVIFNCSKGRIRVERSVNGTKENLIMTELERGREVFSGLCPGEVIFGVGAEVFEKTAFFAQLSVPQSKDEELSEQLQNLVFSADERVSAARAVKSLTSAKNSLKGRAKSGEIPSIENRIAALSDSFESSMQAKERKEALGDSIRGLEEMISEREAKLGELEKERENFDRYEAYLKLKEIERSETEIEEARLAFEGVKLGFTGGEIPNIDEVNAVAIENAKYESTLLRLSEAKDGLDSAKQELDKVQETDLELLESGGEKLGSYAKQKLLFAVAAGLFACAAVLMLVLSQKLLGLALGVAAVFTAVALAVAVVREKRFIKESGYGTAAELKEAALSVPLLRKTTEEKERAYGEAQRKFSELEAESESCYAEIRKKLLSFTPKEGEFSPIIDSLLNETIEANRLKNEYEAKKITHEKNLSLDRKALEAAAEGAYEPLRDKAKLLYEMKFVAEGKKGLESKLAEQEKQRAKEEALFLDPSMILSKLSHEKESLLKAERKHAAFEKALEMIESASDEMKASISPKIGAYAAELFEKASGGKYSSIALDTRLYMNVEGEFGTKSAEYLSAGARESAYLCLRLSLLKLLYGEKSVPIVLDDAFIHLDDQRLKLMIKVITEDAKRQIFIFSCTDREKNCLSSMGIGFNEIRV